MSWCYLCQPRSYKGGGVFSSMTLGVAVAMILTVLCGPAKSEIVGQPGILIQHATVYDGSGKPPFEADIRVQGERIGEVGTNLKARPGESVVNGKGMAIA